MSMNKSSGNMYGFVKINMLTNIYFMYRSSNYEKERK